MIVASLTSIPSRIEHIYPALRSLVEQSESPRVIALTLPLGTYRLPVEISQINRLIIVWLRNDYGPLCKLIGATVVANCARAIIPSVGVEKHKTGSEEDQSFFRNLLASEDEAMRCLKNATAHWNTRLDPGIHSGTYVHAPNPPDCSLVVTDDDIRLHRDAIRELVDRARAQRVENAPRPAVGFGGALLTASPPFFRVQRTTVPAQNRISTLIEFAARPQKTDEARRWTQSVDWLMGSGLALYPAEHFPSKIMEMLINWSADPLMRRADDATIGAALSLQGVPRFVVFPDRKESVLADANLANALSGSLWRASRCHLHAFRTLRQQYGAFRTRHLETCWVVWAVVICILLLSLLTFLFRASTWTLKHFYK
jgi:hypothetical protein